MHKYVNELIRMKNRQEKRRKIRKIHFSITQKKRIFRNRQFEICQKKNEK